MLDGDVVREFITRDLGFSYEDRFENIRRVSWVANIISHYDVDVICSFVTPFKEMRIFIRRYFGEKVTLIHIHGSLEGLIDQDNKGLYKKALNGLITDFTGITQRYDDEHAFNEINLWRGYYGHDFNTKVDEENKMFKELMDNLNWIKDDSY